MDSDGPSGNSRLQRTFPQRSIGWQDEPASSADERRSFAAAQPAAPPPPVSAPSHRAEEAVPLRAAPPVHREIKTGSVRLVDAAQPPHAKNKAPNPETH